MVTWTEALGAVLGKLTKIAVKYWHDVTLAIVEPAVGILIVASGHKMGGSPQIHGVHEVPEDYKAPKWFEGMLGDGAKYAVSTLGDVSEDMATGLIGTAETIGAAVSPTVTTIVNRMVSDLRSAMEEGTLDKETEKEVTTMIAATNKRILAEIKKEWKTPPGHPGLVDAAAGIVVATTGAQAVAEGGGAAIDASHPVKQWQARAIASSIVGTLGFAAIAGTIMRMPLEVSLFAGLRYHFQHEFTPYRPPYADRIRIAVREGHLKEMQVDVPDGFEDEMAYLGYGGGYAKELWGAHWILISRGELRSMFHRGIITRKQLLVMLRYHDIHPAWRENWLKLQYDLPGMIRTSWAYEWGIWGRDKLEEMWEKRGLDPEYVKDITEAEIKNTYRDAISRIRSAKITMYRDGWLTERELRAALNGLEIAGGEIEFLVSEAKIRADRERKEELRDIYVTQYRDDIINRDQLEEKLVGLPMRHDVVMLIVKKELTRKGYFEEAEKVVVEAA